MGQQVDYQDYRLGFRKIARNTDERTMIAAIIPPNFHAENFQSVKTFESGKRLVSPEVIFYLCALMNSLTRRQPSNRLKSTDRPSTSRSGLKFIGLNW